MRTKIESIAISHPAQYSDCTFMIIGTREGICFNIHCHSTDTVHTLRAVLWPDVQELLSMIRDCTGSEMSFVIKDDTRSWLFEVNADRLRVSIHTQTVTSLGQYRLESTDYPDVLTTVSRLMAYYTTETFGPIPALPVPTT